MKNTKPSKKLIKELKPFWLEAKKIRDNFFKEIERLELQLEQSKTGYNEVFFCDGDMVGFGSIDRTLPLIHAEELEKE